MAVNKSLQITTEDNLDLQVESHFSGFLKCKIAELELSGAASDNDVHLMMRIPVGANITELFFASDDLGTTGAFNVGFYKADGSDISTDADAVDEDALATAIDVATAAVAKTDIRYEVKGIETVGQKAWEIAGLSSKPDYEFFYIALTNSAATTAGGTVTLVANFI